MGESATVISAIIAVWTAVANWFIQTLPLFTPIFWADGALTFFGALAVGGMSVGAILLLFMIVTKFMKFSA